MKTLLASAALALCVFASGAHAATISDPTGDFLPGFVGPNDADLDVTSFSVNFNASSQEFLIGAVMAGLINPNRAGFYVIGVNTGTGPIAPFANVGAPNVRFNQVVLVRKDGTGLVTGATGGPLAANAITIVGNLFTARVPLSALPSTGFEPINYLWNLWPRNALGNNNQISDFAPNDGGISAVVPEPSAWAMAVIGFALLGSACRRRMRIRRALA
jgi:hypothetical protein